MWIWARRAAITCLVAFAVYVRADALDDPNYWYDEAITSLRVAGHTEQQVAAFAASHPSFPIGELKQFVQVDSQAGVSDTVRSLATEDAQHTPLYYVAARLWAHVFGSSIEAGRGLAALMSLFALAAMYWLCLELFVKTGAFESTLVCWLGVLTMTLSPYQVALAREHREYALWTLTMTLACAAFLRALRKNTRSAWILYGSAMAVSLYTHLVSAFALAALGVFLLCKERFRFTRAVWGFAGASAAAGFSCLPWFIVLLSRRGNAESSLGWVQHFTQGRFQLRFSLTPVIQLANVSAWEAEKIFTDLVGYRITQAIILFAPFLVLIALWWFGRGPRRVCAGFAAVLMASVSGTLFALDFLTGSTAGWAIRYGVPTNLGWLLALTLLLALVTTYKGPWTVLVRGLAGIFVLTGAISAVITHDAKHTFLKAWEPSEEIVELLNTDGRVALVSDDFVGAVLTLGHEVREDLPLSWRARCYSCPRVLEPQVDIPFPVGSMGQTLFFRSWVNVPLVMLQPLVERFVGDRLGDPRFHTSPVPLGHPQSNLYLLTPR